MNFSGKLFQFDHEAFGRLDLLVAIREAMDKMFVGHTIISPHSDTKDDILKVIKTTPRHMFETSDLQFARSRFSWNDELSDALWCRGQNNGVWLNTLYTAEKVRKMHGFGLATMQGIAKIANERELVAIRGEMRPDARGFYEKIGCQTFGKMFAIKVDHPRLVTDRFHFDPGRSEIVTEILNSPGSENITAGRIY